MALYVNCYIRFALRPGLRSDYSLTFFFNLLDDKYIKESIFLKKVVKCTRRSKKNKNIHIQHVVSIKLTLIMIRKITKTIAH